MFPDPADVNAYLNRFNAQHNANQLHKLGAMGSMVAERVGAILAERYLWVTRASHGEGYIQFDVEGIRAPTGNPFTCVVSGCDLYPFGQVTTIEPSLTWYTDMMVDFILLRVAMFREIAQ